MKLSTLFVLLFAGLFSITKVSAQANASINILTLNSGFVAIGGSVFIQVDIGNTGPVSSIGVYKVRSQISVPTALVSVAATGHILPTGWTITSQSAGVINLSNGTDIIPVNVSRSILIKVNGNTLGGPSTVAGTLSFSNGNPPGTAPGTLAGDNTADNTSQSSIQVYDPVPVTLTDFNAFLQNCQPVLKWITQTEINSDRFEIERSNQNNNDWIPVGVITAKGNTTSKSEYNFVDKTISATSVRVFYRLKMIDKDGRSKYSEVLPVYVNCKTSMIQVYPNPVSNSHLYVSLTGAQDNTDASLLSVSGQVVSQAKLHNGTNNLNVSNIADGEYILILKDSDGLDKKVKVIIQH